MDSALKQLLDRMVVARQLSSIDAEALARVAPAVKTEEDVLRWLANEYGLAYTTLEDLEPDRQLLSLFPARILLKDPYFCSTCAVGSPKRDVQPPCSQLTRCHR